MESIFHQFLIIFSLLVIILNLVLFKNIATTMFKHKNEGFAR